MFGLGALVLAAIAALTLVVPVWAAALVVGVVVLLVAGLLALTGIGQIKRGAPPLPEQAIASVQRDIQTVKDSAKR